MLRTYEAVLRGDRLEWTGPEPDTSEPVRVFVTLADEQDTLTDEERRRLAVEALERIARRGGIASIPDPVEWQREVRSDKPLPGREE
jgi:hypothetical protein